MAMPVNHRQQINSIGPISDILLHLGFDVDVEIGLDVSREGARVCTVYPTRHYIEFADQISRDIAETTSRTRELYRALVIEEGYTHNLL